MNSKIYIGQIQHTRLAPVRHQLQYPLYIYCFDLDELQDIDRSLPLFGYNRFRPASIYDSDYLDNRSGTIREKLDRFLAPFEYSERIKAVMLITSARYCNYVFNPVNFYYCFSADDELICTVAEVNNTFGERHVYIPRMNNGDTQGFPYRFTTRKEFHVSPFNDMAGMYEFIFSDIRKELNIRINLLRNGELTFYAELWGNPIPLTALNHAKTLLVHPLTPSLTIPRVYWEAAKLSFLRKLSYHPKPVPISMMTIRKNPPTFFQKRCMSFIVNVLERTGHGHLTMTFPNGTVRHFGSTGVENGARMYINDFRFFSRVVLSGDIGLGDSYMKGEWDSPDVAETVTYLLENSGTISDGDFTTTAYSHIRDRILHMARENTLAGSRRNIRRHYDLSNDFFKTFLDSTMTYSCAIFRSPKETLEDAQKNKLHTIIAKAQLEKTDHVLEIGCGWGSFAIEAAKITGCRMTAITVSQRQFEYTRELVHMHGLSNRIAVLLKDFREVTGEFDKIVSTEMIEALGHRYLGTFFRCCDRLLKQNGLMVLQTITIPDQRYDRYRKGVDWIRRHIFPGGHLPSLTALSTAMTRHSSFNIEHAEDIGLNYARTLQEWRTRFVEHIDDIAEMGFDRTFRRKWLYYFACCEAAFAARRLGDLQLVIGRLR